MLPAVWLLLYLPIGTAQNVLVAFDAVTPFELALDAALANLGNLVAPALILAALASMVVSRKHPGQLVSRG